MSTSSGPPITAALLCENDVSKLIIWTSALLNAIKAQVSSSSSSSSSTAPSSSTQAELIADRKACVDKLLQSIGGNSDKLASLCNSQNIRQAVTDVILERGDFDMLLTWFNTLLLYSLQQRSSTSTSSSSDFGQQACASKLLFFATEYVNCCDKLRNYADQLISLRKFPIVVEFEMVLIKGSRRLFSRSQQLKIIANMQSCFCSFIKYMDFRKELHLLH